MIRFVLLLTVIYSLIRVNTKASSHSESVVEFKLRMLEKVRADSATTKEKLNHVYTETEKFVGQSSDLEHSIQGSLMVVALWILIELIFLAVRKVRPQPEQLLR